MQKKDHSKKTKQKTDPDLKILAIILSGGAGSRVGGVDKGLQVFKSKTLIEHTISSIEPQVDDIIICINRNETEYNKLGHTLVFDKQTDYQGPLAGVSAAHEWLKTSSQTYDYILISSCDSPLLPPDYVGKLLCVLEDGDKPCAVVNDGERTQNLHCLIRYDALTSLVKFFDNGGRAMHRWHKKIGLSEVDFSDQADCFSNFNFSEQLANS